VLGTLELRNQSPACRSGWRLSGELALLGGCVRLTIKPKAQHRSDAPEWIQFVFGAGDELWDAVLGADLLLMLMIGGWVGRVVGDWVGGLEVGWLGGGVLGV